MTNRTVTTQPRTIYSDFPISFSVHPEKKDLSVVTNDNAVKQSIRNLLLTDRFERLFQPTVGSNIRAMLFEQMTNDTAITLRTLVVETITIFEPRANLQLVRVTPDEQKQSYIVSIVFTTTTVTQPTQLIVTLNRVR